MFLFPFYLFNKFLLLPTHANQYRPFYCKHININTTWNTQMNVVRRTYRIWLPKVPQKPTRTKQVVKILGRKLHEQLPGPTAQYLQTQLTRHQNGQPLRGFFFFLHSSQRQTSSLCNYLIYLISIFHMVYPSHRFISFLHSSYVKYTCYNNRNL